MKFNISSKALYNATSAVSKVINSKNALAILDNFFIKLEGNELTITGSDQENALTARLEVSGCKGEGAFCLGARRLVELLKELPDQGVEVNVNEETLEVQLSYASGHYSFVGLPGDQYPHFTADTTGEAISSRSPPRRCLKVSTIRCLPSVTTNTARLCRVCFSM